MALQSPQVDGNVGGQLDGVGRRGQEPRHGVGDVDALRQRLERRLQPLPGQPHRRGRIVPLHRHHVRGKLGGEVADDLRIVGQRHH